MRSYRSKRFRDESLLQLNIEYRWEVMAALDMALFVDMGKVAAELGQLDLDDLTTSYGTPAFRPGRS